MKYVYRVKLSDTDSAGRIYFASACEIAHEAFEHYMDVIGFGISGMITDGSYGLPVVGLNARYMRSIALGQTISVSSVVTGLKEKTVTFTHTLLDEHNHEAAVIEITHAAVSAKTGRAIDIPSKLAKALKAG